MSSLPPSDPRRALADGVVTRMFADRLVESLVSQLRRDYRQLGRPRLEDAVADGFVALYQKLLRDDVPKPLAFVYKAARNLLNKELDRTPTFLPLPDEDGADALSDSSAAWERDEIRALRREHALRYVLGVVDSWTNGNLKDVTRLLIESAMRGEPLEPIEIAERLALNDGSVRVWKKRGLERLEAHIDSLGLELSDFGGDMVLVDEDAEEEDRFE